MNGFDDPSGTEIAIIGMSGRFPGARNLVEFWQNLCDGVESIRFLDDQELKTLGVDPDWLNDPNYVKAAAVLDDMDLFDAAFFGYTPREAELIDPQHRIFLECAWEALEHAGYNPETYPGAIGVFAGATTNTYLLYNLVSNAQLLSTLDPVQVDVGNGADFLATRVSYKLNLKGPGFTVQTACSTSLVAAHLACQSLLNDECDLALAGGISAHVKHREGYRYLEGSIVSPDGHCRAFDAQANGTVFGSGVGIVVLKRLEDAIPDGDHIHAVIKGSAINNDGSLKVGYTAPSVEGQTAVIVEALSVADVAADTVSYVETHGTGTKLGDPIEIRALTKAFHTNTRAKNYCAIGSVKTNIGHLAGAAGVAGLVKTALALENKLIPPSLHFERPNPEIDFVNSPFFVNTDLLEWKTETNPRRAGVSSFGVGGTNAHLVLQEAPVLEPSGPSRAIQLLPLSAKTGTALESVTLGLAEHLEQNPDIDLADVAYTLQVGRQTFNHRRVVVCRNLDDAAIALETGDPQRVFSGAAEIQDRPVAFMFSGQGAQYVNMALELYQTEPVFREQVDFCAEFLQPHLGFDLRTLLYPAAREIEEAAQQLNQTFIAQPALFTIEYALAQLWMAWGVHPRAMIGHSIGEYVAACLAGVFTLQDGLKLVAARGSLMQSLPAGSMVAVLLSEDEIRPFLETDISLAAANGPSLCTVSGPTPAIEALQNRLDEKGVGYRPLHTSHAFHSAMMDSILEPFTEQVRQIELNPPQIPYISNVTGSWIQDAEATDPGYWAQHLRRAVRFSDGVQELLQDPARILLEVGPGNTLTRLAGQHVRDVRSPRAFSSTRHPTDESSDVQFLLTALGKLWLAGVAIDWNGFQANERRHRLPLPTYPFERQRYWIEAGAQTPTRPAAALHTKANISDWFYAPIWKSSPTPKPFSPGDLPADAGTWLIFSDAHGLGAQMAKRLRDVGQRVTSVVAGEQFGQIEQGSYTLNPRQPDDYAALLDEIDHPLERIVHLWSLTPDQGSQSSAAFFDRCQELGFYSLLFLTRALGGRGLTHPIQIEVVSDHIHSVIGSEVTCPEKATLLGLSRVIPQEYPQLCVRCIDVVMPESGGQPNASLAAQLLAEINSKPVDTIVAYRGKQRWLQSFDPMPLENQAAPLRPLRPNGVYLIVGGSTELGLTLARHLAETVQAKLALVENVSGAASAPPPDNDQRQAEIVRTLEELGARVLIIQADITDESRIRSAVEETTAHMGPIHGVIHAANTADERIFSPIQETGYDECNWHFEKVYSLFALRDALKDQALDFCLLNSSLSTVLGGLGFAAYAASNLFMGAFTQNQNKTSSFPWISVDWDAWQLGGEAEHILALSADLAQFAMSPVEGLEAFRRVLSSSTTDWLVVSTGDLATRAERKHQTMEATRDSDLTPRLTLYERPDLRVDYVAPRDELELQVTEIWQQVLGIKDVGIHDNFFDLGGHSLLATQLRNHLYETFKVELPIRGLFENATVAGIAALIQDNRSPTIDDGEGPIADRLRTVFPTERQALLESYLRPKIAQALSLKVEQLPQEGNLETLDLELVAVDLMWHLKQDLKLQLYPHEITARPSVANLAHFVLAEFDRLADLPALATNEPLSDYTLKSYDKRAGTRALAQLPTQKNESMVFLHSSPRAGSTLLRVMLAGHPDLFCPPELNLLFFEDMQAWRQNIGFGHDFQWTAQGLHWAFVELLGLDSDEGWALLDDLIAQNRPAHSVYAQLQELAGGRLLVDKTPPYSLDLETLERAEVLFESPKYVYLARHPYAVMESLLRLRFDRLFGPSLFEDDDIDPYVIVETVWTLCNRNLSEFFEQIDPERYRLVRFEELVKDPVDVMTGLCQFLDIPFDPTCLNPYDGRRERMMGGLGDPNIFRHTRIDPSLGEAWKHIKWPRRLDETTRQLAIQLGYELPETTETPSISSLASKLSGETDEEQLLSTLDQLSDQEVYAMLSDLLAEEE